MGNRKRPSLALIPHDRPTGNRHARHDQAFCNAIQYYSDILIVATDLILRTHGAVGAGYLSPQSASDPPRQVRACAIGEYSVPESLGQRSWNHRVGIPRHAFPQFG